MKIERATAEQVYEVALAMRQRDFDEISALNFADDRDELAELLARRYIGDDSIMCASLGGKPICIGGTINARPNVISLLFFATDEFPKIGLGVTRFIKKRLMPRLERAGIHRFEAVSLDGYHEVHAWLNLLGLEAETEPLRGFGKNGEAFRYFSKVADVRPACS